MSEKNNMSMCFLKSVLTFAPAFAKWPKYASGVFESLSASTFLGLQLTDLHFCKCYKISLPYTVSTTAGSATPLSSPLFGYSERYFGNT
jgi:hypothetical protein